MSRFAPSGRVTALALVITVVVIAAVGHWYFRMYDPGPTLTLTEVDGVQVAVEGWVDVDVAGPSRPNIEAFIEAADASRSLWPPDLKFP